MDSTTNILIIFIVVGTIVFGAVWALSRNRVSVDVPPAKLDDDSAVAPTPRLDASAPPVEAASTLIEKRQAPEPAAKPKAAAPASPASKRSASPKPSPDKAPTTTKTAPKKVAAKPTPPPLAQPEAPPLTAIGVAGAVGPPDSLLQIKGLGPKLNALLDGLGITRFDQIAAWSEDDVAKVDEHLGAFKGRIERDSWIEQAGFLAKGAIAEFEAKFGKLDSENQ